MNDILPIIVILGAGQGVFLTIALIFKRQNIVTNRILAILIFLFSVELLVSYLVFRRGLTSVLNFYFLIDTFGFLYGPLLFFYTGLLTSQIRKFKKRHLLHLLPFALYVCYDLLFFAMSSQEQHQFISQYLMGDMPLSIYLIDGIVYIALLLYLVLIVRMEMKYAAKITVYFSDIAKINLRWLRVITYCISILWIFAFISFLLFLLNKDWSQGFEQSFYLSVTIFIYIIGYFALFQPEIFSKTHQMDENIPGEGDDQDNLEKDDKNEEKYIKTRLSSNMLEEYIESITQYTQQTKIYLNPEITIKELSDELDIPVHHISQTINSMLSKNFFHFINHFRIEDAKDMLKDPRKKDIPILSIAYESGFNSKATFNSIFKKYTGNTPSEYRNMHN